MLVDFEFNRARSELRHRLKLAWCKPGIDKIGDAVPLEGIPTHDLSFDLRLTGSCRKLSCLGFGSCNVRTFTLNPDFGLLGDSGRFACSGLVHLLLCRPVADKLGKLREGAELKARASHHSGNANQDELDRIFVGKALHSGNGWQVLGDFIGHELSEDVGRDISKPRLSEGWPKRGWRKSSRAWLAGVASLPAIPLLEPHLRRRPSKALAELLITPTLIKQPPNLGGGTLIEAG